MQRGIVATNATSAHQKRDVSPVTVADFMVQVLVLGSLSRAFPADKFIAEETGAELLAAGAETRASVLEAVNAHSQVDLSEADALATLNLGISGLEDSWSRTGRTWVLDPVDGTKGFLRGDQYAVALSLLDGGEPVLGLLGCPNLEGGALFWAETGHGAHWGPTHGSQSDVFASGLDAAAISAACTPLRVSQPGVGGLVRCEAYESKHTNWGVAEAIGTKLGITQPPIRIDGQGKYGLLARGEAHVFTRLPPAGYVEKIWDVAAGACILTEAGGRVTDTNGAKIDFSRGAFLDTKGVVASNGAVHDRLLEALAEAT